jgi:hypothetical protein
VIRVRRSLVLILSVLLIVTLAGPSEAAPPVNDDFADALALAEPLPALAAASTAEATTQIGEPEPSCIDDGEFGASVWYTFTPSAKVSAALDTIGSNFNTVAAIYTGSTLAGLTEIACSDEISFSPATQGWSRAAGLLSAETTYRIQISGILAATGNLQLRLVKRRTTPAVVRGSTWFLNSGFDPNGEFNFAFGTGNDDPLPGTYLAALFGENGVSGPAVRVGNTWVMNDWFDAASFLSIGYGRSMDFPVAGDRDADGDADIGVVQGNLWLFDTDLDGLEDDDFAYGSAKDHKLMGDWDGDGDFTPGVIKGNTWFLNNGTDPNADLVFGYGSASDFPVVGDWDGDGDWTPGVVKGNLWFLNNSTGPNADIVFGYGRATDFRVVGDWDGAVG